MSYFLLDLYNGRTNEKKTGTTVQGNLSDARSRAIKMLKLDAPKDYRAWVKITQWDYPKQKKAVYKGDVARHNVNNKRVFVWYIANSISIYKLNTNGTTGTKYV